jgi:hypothetical protein
MKKFHRLIAVLILMMSTKALGQARIYSWPKPTDSNELREGSTAEIQAIRDSLTNGAALDDAQGKRLLDILGNPQQGLLEREAALGLLCERAGKKGSDTVVALVHSLLTRLGNIRSPQDTEAYALPELLMAFFGEEAPKLAAQVGQQRTLLELYMDVLEGPRGAYWTLRAPACARIADNPAPLPVRQEYMLRVLATMPHLPAPEEFYTLFDANVAAAVRELAFAAPAGMATGNQAAFDLLVECGDLETTTRLEQWMATLGHDVAVLRQPGGSVWKIRAKHDPKLLLDHIRSTGPAFATNSSGPWALSRAIRNGEDRPLIREAVLEHFRNCELAHLKLLFWELSNMHRLTVQPGILTADDLAELRKRLDEQADAPKPEARNGD